MHFVTYNDIGVILGKRIYKDRFHNRSKASMIIFGLDIDFSLRNKRGLLLNINWAN